MATLPNPTINPPRLQHPSQDITRHSSSHSTSPEAHAVLRLQSISQDPILRNLSPTKTLRALRNTSPTRHTEVEVGLMKSVEHVSEEDREFAVRVAQTCKDLREWATEVEAWEWPGTFEPPPTQERAAKRRRMLMDHHIRGSYFDDDDSDEEEEDGFWGSLPRDLVQAYEMRIEEIHQAMDDLNVEDLKNHVRSVHILPKSAKAANPDEYVSFRVRSLDDFTALVTATILQALPYLSWLTRLLNEWSVRLIILRKVPGFLTGLEDTKLQLDLAWQELSSKEPDSREAASPVRSRFEGAQKVLGSRISALGQRLDSMLDELEGRSETVPNSWIDSFEALEYGYSNYAVKAERTLTGLAWEFDLPSDTAPTTPGLDALGISTGYYAAQQIDSATPGNLQVASEPTMIDRQQGVESPTLGNYPVTINNIDSTTTLPDRPAPKLRQDSGFTRLVDDVVAASQDQSQMPTDFATIDAEGQRSPELPPVPGFEEPSAIPPSPTRSSKSPRIRTRHIPINVDAYRNASMPPPTFRIPVEDEPYSSHRAPPLPLPTDPERPATSGSSIAARRAVYNGDLENKQILLKASSPVRPFEHASTAFTKLFKAANSRELSRARSTASRNTLKKRSTSRPRNSFSSTRVSDLILDEALPIRTSTQKDSAARLSGSSASIQRRSVQEIVNQPTSEGDAGNPVQKQDWSDKEVIVIEPEANNLTPSPNENTNGRQDSPFNHLRSSGQWPLARGSKAFGNEIGSPETAISSDAFEQMFVDTLPTSPVMDEESYSTNLIAFESYIDNLKRIHDFGEAADDPAMADGVYSHALEDIKSHKSRKHRKGSKGRKKSSKHHEKRELASPLGHETLNTGQSPISTPEIEHASSAVFFKGYEVHHRGRMGPGKVAQRSDLYQRAPDDFSRLRSHRMSRGRIILGMEDEADASAGQVDGDHIVEVQEEGSGPSETVQSSGSDGAMLSGTTDPHASNARRGPRDSQASSHYEPSLQSSPHLGRERSDTSRSEPVFPMPPTHGKSLHTRSKSTKDGKSMLQALRSDSERSVVGAKLGAVKPMPLTFGSGATETGQDGTGPVYPTPITTQIPEADEPRPSTPARSEKRRDSTASNVMGDYMDQHVNQVLKKMTSNIQFHPRASPTGFATIKTEDNADMFDLSKESPPDAHAGLTLVPANPSEPTLKRHVKDGETKLYHLSQPGREQPIKLFVRLVGENERVMVRVGGGWMDLEDYLRQYAEHHTRRTLSGGQVEVTEAARVGASERKRSSLIEDGRRSDHQNYERPATAMGMRDHSEDLASSPTEAPKAVADGDPAATPDNLSSTADTTTANSVSGPGQALSSQPSTYFDAQPHRTTISNGTPPGGHKLDPLRSNPLFPKITPPPAIDFRSSTSSQYSRPDSVIHGSVGSTSTVMSGNTAAGTVGSYTPPKESRDAQKARWVEDMIARAKQGATAGKTQDRSSRGSGAWGAGEKDGRSVLVKTGRNSS